MSRFALALLATAATVAGCGAGHRRVLTVEEVPAGTCPRQTLEPGESCSTSARDYSAGVTVGSPHGNASQLGGTAWFRWPLFDVAIDERRVRKAANEYHSLAGAIGTHLRPLIFWPHIHRYVDVVVNLGFDLGVIKRDSHVEGRGDGYVGVALDLYAPDAGPFRYLCSGVPGIRIGARYTAYVLGWESETTFELGLIWRWGVPVDLHRRWTWQRGGD
jgi:hypothetical protein